MNDGPWTFAAGELLRISRTAKARCHQHGWTARDVDEAVRRPDVVVAGESRPRARRGDQVERRVPQWRYVRGDLVVLVEKEAKRAGHVAVTVERLTDGDQTWLAIRRETAHEM